MRKIQTPQINLPLIVVGDSLHPVFSSIIFPIVIPHHLNMDEAMEELWKKFTLSEEEKGVLLVNAQDVARSKEQA